MCLFAYAAEDRGQIPTLHLDRAHTRNDDAWGIMFPDAGRVRLIREASDHLAFLAAWNRTPRQTRRRDLSGQWVAGRGRKRCLVQQHLFHRATQAAVARP